jgi:hypothetical protein
MWVGIVILAVILALPGGVLAAASPPRVGSDGTSLVLEGSDSPKGATSEDTLYQLLGQEVQVFIFNSKTRVWPQGYSMRSASRSFRPLANPQLEALISKYAALYGVDASLVRAVMRHESGFNSGAVSPKGAQGLMQLMPGTAALMGVRNPFNPEENIAGGVGYLRRCLDRFHHNVPLAVAAYNAGPEAVSKYCSIPPYAETQLFVHSVMGSYTGQTQKGTAPGGSKSPSAAPGKASKMSKQGTPQEKTPKEARRPRPKIIEVRPAKAPRVVSNPKD